MYTKIILKPTNVGVWEITWHEYDAQVTGISNFLGIYHSTNPPNIEDMIEHILNAYGEDLTSSKITDCSRHDKIMFETKCGGYYLASYKE